jgi:hypothetical protein
MLEQEFVVERDFRVPHGNFSPAALPAQLARTYKAGYYLANPMPAYGVNSAISVCRITDVREKLV